MSERLIKSFLENSDVRSLYNQYRESPNAQIKEEIELLFSRHVLKINILSYFSKVLVFEAQRFDKKAKMHASTNQLIFDGDKNLALSNLFHDTSHDMTNVQVDVISTNIEGLFENRNLYSIIASLELKDKQLLYLLFAMDMKDKELSLFLGVSQQAINKRKHKLFSKMRSSLEIIEGGFN